METGLSNRLQPWQALFALLSYAVGIYGIDDEKALILYGIIAACMGFVMQSNYRHKQAIKEIVAPWLVEQLLNTLSEYLEKPPTPEEIEAGYIKTPDVDVETSARDLKAKLKAQIQALEATKNGSSDRC